MMYGKNAVLVVNVFIQLTENKLALNCLKQKNNVFPHVIEQSMGIFESWLDTKSQVMS